MNIRKVNMKDAEQILKIRNNPEIFKYFRNSTSIWLKDHLIWFNEYIKNDKNVFIVLEIDWIIQWYWRKDFIKNNEFEISILVSPNIQQKWYWKKILKSLLDNTFNWEIIYAEILKDNIWSQKLFDSFWFKEDKINLNSFLLKLNK